MAEEMWHQSTRKMRKASEDHTGTKAAVKQRKISRSKPLWEDLVGTSWEEETTSERMARREEMKSMKLSPFSDHEIKTMKELFDAEDMILFISRLETNEKEMHQRLISTHRRMRLEILERLAKMACRKASLLDMPLEIILRILSELQTFSDLLAVKQVCKKLKQVGDGARLKMRTLKMSDVHGSGLSPATCAKYLDKKHITSFAIQYSPEWKLPLSLAEDILTLLPNATEVTLIGSFPCWIPLPRHVETVHLEEVTEKHYLDKRTFIEYILNWTGKFYRTQDPGLEGLPCKRVVWKDDKIFLHDGVEDLAKNVLVVVPYEVQLRDVSDNLVFSTRHFACGPKAGETLRSYLNFPNHDFFRRVVNCKWSHDGFSKRCERDIEERFGEEHRKTALVVGFRRRFLRDRVRIEVDVEEFDEDPNDQADY